jgi:uncharacterized membrane protein
VAGIGFELRKLLQRDSYSGLLQAYAYAGIISSGPWILSIVGILAIGLLSEAVVVPARQVAQFQVSVTYLMMGSLVLTGAVQLGFTRFIADRLFRGDEASVLPNFNGLMLATLLVSGCLAVVVALAAFPGQSDLYRVLMIAGFVILCCIWVATVFLSGMKQYREILGMFALGYAVVVGSALTLRPLGLEGLLLGFDIGHFVLLVGMVVMVLRNYPSPRFVAFDFARRGAMYPALLATGFMYNAGIWADKLLFWYDPDASQAVIGPLRASVVYDVPIFLAYLAIIPGMAAFLVRIETDFVEYYGRFYDAVREGGSLDRIERLRDEMVFTIRRAIYEIVQIQAIATLLVLVAGPALLRLLGIPELYVPLLNIDVVASGLQVMLLGVLNVFFYLDKRAAVTFLTALFLVLNVGLTAISLRLGAAFYGYGFALALLATLVVGVRLLELRLRRLEYETFMLQ